MDRGYFITLEGTDKSGKTTHIERLARWLKGQGHSILTTREPGGTPVGEKIRRILLGEENREITPMAEMLLFAAARAQHVDEVIEPALAAGRIVLCDRFIDSSIAYQAWARGLDEADVLAVNMLAVQGVVPDLTLFMDIDPEEGMRRWRKHPERADHFDRQGLAFHKKVREGFLSLVQEYPDRITLINAVRDADRVFADICAAVSRLLKTGD